MAPGEQTSKALIVNGACRVSRQIQTASTVNPGAACRPLLRRYPVAIRMFHMAEPSAEELKARIAELEQKLSSRKSGKLEFRVSEKGGVSVYGMGRFPVTLYYEQWMRLLGAADELRAFIEENKHRLKTKESAE